MSPEPSSQSADRLADLPETIGSSAHSVGCRRAAGAVAHPGSSVQRGGQSVPHRHLLASRDRREPSLHRRPVAQGVGGGGSGFEVVDWHKVPGHLRHRDRQSHHRRRRAAAGQLGDPAPQPPVRQAPRRRQAGRLAPGRLLLAAVAQPGSHRLASDRRRRCRQHRHAGRPPLAPPRPTRLPRQHRRSPPAT